MLLSPIHCMQYSYFRDLEARSLPDPTPTRRSVGIGFVVNIVNHGCPPKGEPTARGRLG